jgi:tripartite-type tricarboxylate transporter receptor subunit TctC
MRRVLPQIGGMLALAAATVAIGQTPSKESAYPTRAIRLIVPFAPGGTADVQARMLGEKLTQRFQQQVVVDNRPGAGGNIGMEMVARAPADGHTIVIAFVGSWAVNPHLYKLSFDVVNDFAPITLVASTPGVMAVHPSLPAKNVKEFIALARQKPGALTYGSAGVGLFGHIAGELFDSMAKTKMTHVPYKGAGPMLLDVIGGHIHVSFESATPAIPHIASKRLKALAVTSASRAEVLPDVPTIAEAGVPGYQCATWSAIAAPARTPRAIVELLNKEINAIMQTPEFKEPARLAGSTILGGTPEQFHEYLKTELAKYGRLVKEIGMKLE